MFLPNSLPCINYSFSLRLPLYTGHLLLKFQDTVQMSCVLWNLLHLCYLLQRQLDSPLGSHCFWCTLTINCTAALIYSCVCPLADLEAHWGQQLYLLSDSPGFSRSIASAGNQWWMNGQSLSITHHDTHLPTQRETPMGMPTGQHTQTHVSLPLRHHSQSCDYESVSLGLYRYALL